MLFERQIPPFYLAKKNICRTCRDSKTLRIRPGGPDKGERTEILYHNSVLLWDEALLFRIDKTSLGVSRIGVATPRDDCSYEKVMPILLSVLVLIGFS